MQQLVHGKQFTDTGKILAWYHQQNIHHIIYENVSSKDLEI